MCAPVCVCVRVCVPKPVCLATGLEKTIEMQEGETLPLTVPSGAFQMDARTSPVNRSCLVNV